MRFINWITKPIRYFMPSQWEKTAVNFPIPSMAGLDARGKLQEKLKMIERIKEKKISMKSKGWKMGQVYQSGPYMLVNFKRLK